MNFPDSLPEPPRPLTTKEGWRDQLELHSRERVKPKIPPNWRTVSDMAKERFNAVRTAHHNSFGPVRTPALLALNERLLNLAATNLKATSGARPGAVIDGLANRGKTTSLVYFGCEYEMLLREYYGDRMAAKFGAEWHPVVYVSLNAQASVKGLNSSIAHFYGAMVSKHATTYQLTQTVVEHAQKCATTLFLVDDIHYLNLRQEGAREVTNHLKQLANETSATFVYAGIGLSETKLLTEGQPDDKAKFGQMRGRFARFPMDAFEADTEAGKADWLRLVKSFEDELVLRKAHEGHCTNLSEYLFKRTKGVVGSLSNLLRRGAALAIEDGTEKITKKLLSRIKLDDAAEARWADS